jgi:hypothetical protein
MRLSSVKKTWVMPIQEARSHPFEIARASIYELVLFELVGSLYDLNGTPLF